MNMPERRDPVPDSAKYYLFHARAHADEGKYSDALFNMREAFNHLENAAYAEAAEVDRLKALTEQLQEGHKKLHARCHQAEAALPSWQDIETSKFVSGSLGRAFLAYGFTKAKEEIARLTAALHAAKAHPDFSYIVIPASDLHLFHKWREGEAWEPCPEATVAPGDECWRRRKEGN